MVATERLFFMVGDTLRLGPACPHRAVKARQRAQCQG